MGSHQYPSSSSPPWCEATVVLVNQGNTPFCCRRSCQNICRLVHWCIFMLDFTRNFVVLTRPPLYWTLITKMLYGETAITRTFPYQLQQHHGKSQCNIPQSAACLSWTRLFVCASSFSWWYLYSTSSRWVLCAQLLHFLRTQKKKIFVYLVHMKADKL